MVYVCTPSNVPSVLLSGVTRVGAANTAIIAYRCLVVSTAHVSSRGNAAVMRGGRGAFVTKVGQSSSPTPPILILWNMNR